MSRGALIVLEGCDRVGKTTHSKLLYEALKEEGYNVESLRFPDRSTGIGDYLNKYLEGSVEVEDHAVHLLFSANRWEQVPKMLRLLNSGTSLIVDRYAYSGVAFSYAKKGLNFSWCKQADVGLPKPDLVLYLDLSAEAMVARSGFGKERYETEDFQNEVKKVYGLLREDNWKVVNTDKEQSEVQEEIQNIVKETIKSILPNSACDTLWTDNFETYV